MAWTVPPTFLPEDSLTSDDLNMYLRDNLEVSEPAVMTAAHQILVTDGLNQVAGRRPVQNVVSGEVSTSGQTPVNIGSPSLSVTHNGAVMVLFASRMHRTGTAGQIFTATEVSGDANNAATEIRALSYRRTNWIRSGAFIFYYGLTPGTSTIQMMHWTNTVGTTGVFAAQTLIAIPL